MLSAAKTAPACPDGGWWRRRRFTSRCDFWATRRSSGSRPRPRRWSAAAAMSAPLSLSLGPGGTFGGRRARVLWIGLEGELERLERLAGSLNEQLAVEGWDPPDRPLRPHITLGRARRSATREQAEAGRRVAAQVETSDRSFAVSSIRLNPQHADAGRRGVFHAGHSGAGRRCTMTTYSRATDPRGAAMQSSLISKIEKGTNLRQRNRSLSLYRAALRCTRRFDHAHRVVEPGTAGAATVTSSLIRGPARTRWRWRRLLDEMLPERYRPAISSA